MAVLRPNEERSNKGVTTRVNPTIVFKQDQFVRTITGSRDWRTDPNPDYHAPITAQVQDGKILFFEGVPDTSASRAAAKELKKSEVLEKAPYIIKNLERNPIKYREVKPTVFEVKLAKVGDVDVTELSEVLSADGQSVTVTAVEPDLRPNIPKSQRLVAEASA